MSDKNDGRCNKKGETIFIGISFLIIGFIEYIRQYFYYNCTLWPWLFIFAGIFMLNTYFCDTKRFDLLVRSLLLIFIGFFFIIAFLLSIKLNPAFPVMIVIIVIALYIYFFESNIQKLLLTVNLVIFIFFLLVIVSYFKNKYWYLAFFIFGIFMIIRGLFYKKIISNNMNK